MKLRKTLGQMVKDKRQARQLTQKELAAIIGCTREYVAQIETDKYKPSYDRLLELARVLDLDLNYLK